MKEQKKIVSKAGNSGTIYPGLDIEASSIIKSGSQSRFAKLDILCALDALLKLATSGQWYY